MTSAQIKLFKEHTKWLKGDTIGKRINIFNRNFKNGVLNGLDLSKATILACNFTNITFINVRFNNSHINSSIIENCIFNTCD